MHDKRVCFSLLLYEPHTNFRIHWLWSFKIQKTPVSLCVFFFLLITYVFPIFYKWEKLHAGHAFNDTAREIDWIPFLDHLMSIMLLSTFDGRTCMYVCVCVQCAHLYIVQQHSGMYDILCDYVIERNEWIPSRRPWSSSFLIQSRHQRINRF